MLRGFCPCMRARLAAALATSTDGRITQTLAAGPQLVDHYQQPTEPHGLYGHAVITAAMDAMPRELLVARLSVALSDPEHFWRR